VIVRESVSTSEEASGEVVVVLCVVLPWTAALLVLVAVLAVSVQHSSAWTTEAVGKRLEELLDNFSTAMHSRTSADRNIKTARSVIHMFQSMSKERLENVVKSYDDKLEQRLNSIEGPIDKAFVDSGLREVESYAEEHNAEVVSLMSCFIANFTGGFAGSGCDPTEQARFQILEFFENRAPANATKNTTDTPPAPTKSDAEVATGTSPEPSGARATAAGGALVPEAPAVSREVIAEDNSSKVAGEAATAAAKVTL